MKSILYLSYDGITDALGQSQILPYLKGLSFKGYQFFLIGFEKKKAFSLQKDVVEKEIENSNIHWLPMKYHKWPPIVSTIYDILVMRKAASLVCRKNDIQIVHCRSYIPMLIGLYLKRKYGVKLLFDMRGFWANERVDGKLWNLNNPIHKRVYTYFKAKEIIFVNQADHIVSLTHAGKEEITSGRLFKSENIKVDTQKISIIPCATDFCLFNPDHVSVESQVYWRDKLKIAETDKILIYLGSLGTWYMVDEMLQFYIHFRRRYSNFKFLFVTKDDTQNLLDKSNTLGINMENILIASADRNQVPELLKLANLGIFFIQPAYSKKASSAVKMGEMIAMGLPFITNKGVGDTDMLIDEIKFGMAIDLNKTQEALEKQVFDQQLEKMSAFKYLMSQQDAVDRYSTIYDDMLNSNTGINE
jgi:glycosyltransferase involved in cell wall biosynthesis